MREFEEVLKQCSQVLPGHGPDQSIKTILLELAEGLEGTENGR